MRNPICFALDVPSSAEADRLINVLYPHVGAFKVGLELFIAAHREGWWPSTSVPLVLDLKLHDIPETVARAVKAGGDLGAKLMTLHVQQRAALEAAVKAAEPFGIQLLGVTVLTSMKEEDVSDLARPRGLSISDLVDDLFDHGRDCGLSGFVCSPLEVSRLKSALPEGFFLVPGVRPAGAALGDQQRVGTPSQAVKDGASLIVVGRPIRDAINPAVAAQEILQEVQAEVPLGTYGR